MYEYEDLSPEAVQSEKRNHQQVVGSLRRETGTCYVEVGHISLHCHTQDVRVVQKVTADGRKELASPWQARQPALTCTGCLKGPGGNCISS